MPSGAQKFVLVALLALGISATAQSRIIYSATADPHADIAQAVKTATSEHKHIILDVGGNWCGDCQVLDIYFHQQPNLPLLERNYVLVHVDVGHMDKNTDVAEKYGIPLKRGVPALAVLDEHGHLLYSQKDGEFEAMRRMDPASVTEFLNQWKPKK
ncbi:MAG: thioredoxin family protein [Acidobacteriaceae bacterium]|nr:thioredoxin family protein [Acidobacteriaceae bacterium]